MRKFFCSVGCFAAMFLLAASLFAQRPGVNIDEAKVPPYTLPDLLTTVDGQAVETEQDWFERRRPEILDLFQTEIYGRFPARDVPRRYEVVEVDRDALDGTAVRKQVAIVLGDGDDAQRLQLLLYLPKKATGPVPVFLGLNFHGNHTILADEAILVPTGWMRNNPDLGVTDNRAKEASRGGMARRWPIELVLDRGYGVATIYYGDIDPDFDDGYRNGVHPLLAADPPAERGADAGGSIAAWAWGLSRALDYLETDADVNARQVAVLGHSRLGKTALWAGASDPRFAIVISNDSGCGGAALSKRCFGERVKKINDVNPHWFCDNFKKYNEREEDLPLDQHMLIALIAPRPAYVASASEDTWADPRGEFLSAKLAAPVYQLLGKEGLSLADFPQPGEGGTGTIGYHLRPGRHDLLSYDWERFLDFADRHWER